MPEERLISSRPSSESDSGLVPLGRGARGLRGVVERLDLASAPANGIDSYELERRLLEIGFVEGARVEILHEGFVGRDPIAVKLDDMRVALRRREADAVLIRPTETRR